MVGLVDLPACMPCRAVLASGGLRGAVYCARCTVRHPVEPRCSKLESSAQDHVARREEHACMQGARTK